MTDATIKDGDGQKCFWHDNLMIRKVTENGEIISDAELRIITGQHDSIDTEDNKTVLGQVYEYRKKSATTDEVRSLIHEWLGPVDHFNKGQMYYYAPVKNLPFTFTEDGADVYGVVRNAWYQYHLTGITGIGTPVDKPDEPIVPNRTGLKDELKFRIDLLEWHTEDINVPLSPFN